MTNRRTAEGFIKITYQEGEMIAIALREKARGDRAAAEQVKELPERVWQQLIRQAEEAEALAEALES